MSSQGYSRLHNDPSSSNTFVADSFQQQEVSSALLLLILPRRESSRTRMRT